VSFTVRVTEGALDDLQRLYDYLLERAQSVDLHPLKKQN
jgi:hypothetical protein